jgi:hypothetical protein
MQFSLRSTYHHFYYNQTLVSKNSTKQNCGFLSLKIIDLIKNHYRIAIFGVNVLFLLQLLIYTISLQQFSIALNIRGINISDIS